MTLLARYLCLDRAPRLSIFKIEYIGEEEGRWGIGANVLIQLLWKIV